MNQQILNSFFPTRQVKVVRFYVSCLLLLSFLPSFPPSSSSSRCQPSTASRHVQCFLPDLNCDPLRRVFSAGPPAIIRGQCSLPGLNREPLRPVFPAAPQQRPPAASAPCRTSTATCCAQCSLPDLNREIECQKECQKICQKECQTECEKECQTECQKICQKECQTECQEICQKECQKSVRRDVRQNAR